MKSEKGDNNVEFLIEHIISRYVVPSKFFMDNDPSFKYNEVKKIVINIIFKGSFLPLIILKVMIKQKLLISS